MSMTDSLQILVQNLQWLGVIVPENSSLSMKFIRFAYPLFAYIMVIDCAILCIFHLKLTDDNLQLSLATFFAYIFPLLIWHSIYNKGKSLIKVIKLFQKVSKYYIMSDNPSRCFLKIILVINVILSLPVFLSSFIYTDEAYTVCKIYFYNSEEICKRNNIKTQLYVFTKTLLLHSVSSLFNNVVAFVYCCLCYRCFALLRSYRNHVKKIRVSKKYGLLQPDLGADYMILCDIVTSVNNIFSIPSFLLLTVAFWQAFIVLARILFVPEDLTSVFYMMEIICLRLPVATFVFVIPACAARVSKEMFEIKLEFERLYDTISFNFDRQTLSENLQILSLLKEIDPIQLSAWEIIELEGSTIPSTLGTLITYGLLIMSLNT